MSWTTAGVQSGTDTSLAGITTVTGVVQLPGPTTHRIYSVPNTVPVLTINGTLSWNPDIEQLVLGDNVRVVQGVNSNVTIGELKTINGKQRYSQGTGLVMNRSTATIANTNAANWQVSSGTTQGSGGKLTLNGGQIKTAGVIFIGSDTTPDNNYAELNINGWTDLQNINSANDLHIFRAFIVKTGVNINAASYSGAEFGCTIFSSLGFNTIKAQIYFANFQADGNGQKPIETVRDGQFLDNVQYFDYVYGAQGNSTVNINKYVFRNSDVGTNLRTGSIIPTQNRIGVVELTKMVGFNVVNDAGASVTSAVSYMKLLGASMNPAPGSRYAGVDDYMTPRTYIAESAAGITPVQEVLYGVAQAYDTNTANAMQPLTMDSLTTKAGNVQDAVIWSYGHLVGLPSVTLRGTGTLTQAWTLFADPYVTLSRAAALAKLASSFTVNPGTMTVAVTADSTYDDLYDALKAYKCSTTQAQIEAPAIGQTIVTASGEQLTAYAGWTLVVNNGITLSEGARFKKVAFDTVTINGAITGIYTSSAGTSTVWQFEQVAVGSSLVVYDEAGVTKYFQEEVATTGTYKLFIPPGTTGTWTYAVEKYGKKREDGTFPANAGTVLFYVPDYADDVGVTQSSLSTVKAYTAIETPSKFYDRTAVFRLTEVGIKLGQIATRAGTAIEIGAFSGRVRDDASSVFNISAGVITIKSPSFESDTKYNKIIAIAPATFRPQDTELVTIPIEDADGNSQCIIAGTANNLIDVWKIPNSTLVSDFTTGTKISSNIGNGGYRFTGEDGFKLVFNNKDNGIYRYCSMSKGDYTAGWYLYDSPAGGLTDEQQNKLNTLYEKNNATFAQVNSLMTGFDPVTDTVRLIRSAVDSVPTLAEIEGSTALAKSSEISDLSDANQASHAATQDAITALPTDIRSELVTELGRIDTSVSSRLAESNYTAPDNTKIGQIKTKVDTLVNTDLTGVMTSLDAIPTAEENAAMVRAAMPEIVLIPAAI